MVADVTTSNRGMRSSALHPPIHFVEGRQKIATYLNYHILSFWQDPLLQTDITPLSLFLVAEIVLNPLLRNPAQEKKNLQSFRVANNTSLLGQ